jgi:hypothetical protein
MSQKHCQSLDWVKWFSAIRTKRTPGNFFNQGEKMNRCHALKQYAHFSIPGTLTSGYTAIYRTPVYWITPVTEWKTLFEPQRDYPLLRIHSETVHISRFRMISSPNPMESHSAICNRKSSFHRPLQRMHADGLIVMQWKTMQSSRFATLLSRNQM